MSAQKDFRLGNSPSKSDLVHFFHFAKVTFIYKTGNEENRCLEPIDFDDFSVILKIKRVPLDRIDV